MNTLSYTLDIVVIAVFLLNICTDFYIDRRKNQRQKETEKSIMEISTRAGDVVKKLYSGLDAKLNTILEELQTDIFDGALHPLSAPVISPVIKKKVYSAIFARAMESRLVLHPCDSLEELIAFAKTSLGDGWILIASANIEVNAPKKSILDEKREEKEGKKEKGITDYVTTLEYAKEKFAETPTQKRALETIIGHVRKFYGENTAR